ncbi:hypothetical protein [Nocardia sp. NPDC050175]
MSTRFGAGRTTTSERAELIFAGRIAAARDEDGRIVHRRTQSLLTSY